MSDYIVSSDECMEGLSDVGIKHYQCLKYHWSPELCNESEIPEQYAVGKSILGDDPQLQTSMRNLLQSMMVD